MKFLIDMPVTPGAVGHLGRSGHDAVHAAMVGLGTVPDAEILAAARREQRIVVTADLDYPRLLAIEATEGPGVILFRGGSYSDQEMLASWTGCCLLSRDTSWSIRLRSSTAGEFAVGGWPFHRRRFRRRRPKATFRGRSS